MEHIVQFGVSVDDEAIKRAIVDSATRQVAEEIRKSVTNSILEPSYRGNKMCLTVNGEKIIREAVAQYKDEIVAGAVRLVAESVTRSKKYRDFLSKLADDMEEEGET